jgi:hypothetical protein
MGQFLQINVAAAGTLNNGAFLVQVDQIENIVQSADVTTVITLTDATTFTLTHIASYPATTPTAKNAIVNAFIVQSTSTLTTVTSVDGAYAITHAASSPVTTPTMKDAIVEAIVATPGSPFTAKVAGPTISAIVVT